MQDDLPLLKFNHTPVNSWYLNLLLSSPILKSSGLCLPSNSLSSLFQSFNSWNLSSVKTVIHLLQREKVFKNEFLFNVFLQEVLTFLSDWSLCRYKLICLFSSLDALSYEIRDITLQLSIL